jgi:hypothetical protein
VNHPVTPSPCHLVTLGQTSKILRFRYSSSIPWGPINYLVNDGNGKHPGLNLTTHDQRPRHQPRQISLPRAIIPVFLPRMIIAVLCTTPTTQKASRGRLLQGSGSLDACLVGRTDHATTTLLVPRSERSSVLPPDRSLVFSKAEGRRVKPYKGFSLLFPPLSFPTHPKKSKKSRVKTTASRSQTLFGNARLRNSRFAAHSANRNRVSGTGVPKQSLGTRCRSLGNSLHLLLFG